MSRAREEGWGGGGVRSGGVEMEDREGYRRGKECVREVCKPTRLAAAGPNKRRQWVLCRFINVYED